MNKTDILRLLQTNNSYDLELIQSFKTNFVSFEDTNIPCENEKPCFDRFGNSCNNNTIEQDGRTGTGGGGGDNSDFQCLGDWCCTPLGCFNRNERN